MERVAGNCGRITGEFVLISKKVHGRVATDDKIFNEVKDRGRTEQFH